MPEHLQQYLLDEALREQVTELGKWLQQNGKFEVGIPGFDKCSSEDLERHVAVLRQQVVTLFNTIRSSTENPRFWGVTKPCRGGAWMTNDHEQFLVPIRVLGESSPYIVEDKKTPKFFTPGTAYYFAPGKLAFVSGDVEFFFVH